MNWLRGIVTAFRPPPVANPLDSRTKGNLGESIAAFIGIERDHVGHRCDGPNFHNPLSNISRSEIDLFWIRFDDGPNGDYVWLQEIKTSTDPNLAVARDLRSDFEKLFGTDVQLTLASRLQAYATKLRFAELRPDLASRILALGAIEPSNVSRVTLEPTILTEPGYSTTAESRIVGAETALTTLGWSASLISSKIVVLDNLEDRLARIAGGSY